MRFLKFCHLLYIAAPQFFLFSMWAMAWHASRFLGHWPIYMIDDPKNIGKGDIAFHKLWDVVDFTCGIAAIAFFLTLPFIASLYSGGISKTYRRCILLLAVLSWLLLLFDPSGALAWIID